ncbi:MAG: hypothetical protein GXP27_15205 [Planctomycetes bacterium]|nr:hypothetical protein [Planctomycetota bacterium]
MFDYNRFLQLQESELYEYMEPLLQQESLDINSDALNRMLRQLPEFDQYHLVYALEIGARCAPELFLNEVVGYLVHPEGAVWSTAYRILSRLPAEARTDELIARVRQIAAENPTNANVAEILAKLEQSK